MVEHAIETFELTRKFGDLVAVDHVNFKVRQGELWGLLGPNGAGKTTIVRMLCCLLTPTKGTAKVGGYDVQKEAGAIRKLMGVCPQETTVYERLTGRENVDLRARRYDIVAFVEARDYETVRKLSLTINAIEGVEQTETVVEA